MAGCLRSPLTRRQTAQSWDLHNFTTMFSVPSKNVPCSLEFSTQNQHAGNKSPNAPIRATHECDRPQCKSWHVPATSWILGRRLLFVSNSAPSNANNLLFIVTSGLYRYITRPVHSDPLEAQVFTSSIRPSQHAPPCVHNPNDTLLLCTLVPREHGTFLLPPRHQRNCHGP